MRCKEYASNLAASEVQEEHVLLSSSSAGVELVLSMLSRLDCVHAVAI